MEKKITLSIEQMKHLESLGLDTSDASMEWQYVSWEGYELRVCNDNCVAGELGIPAYTLQDILEKLPKSIEQYELVIHFDEMSISYQIDDNFILRKEYDDNPLDLAHTMLLWCIENNYIKTNKV